MKRENENDSEFAGCNLMKQVKDYDFIRCKKMIFSFD